jgi:esterase
MPDIQLPNIRLYYEERGKGLTILGIHGGLESTVVWEKAAEELAGLGRVITYDRRGYGRSQRPEPDLITHVHEHADDAAALLKALSATPAIVIGNSQGGLIATDLAIRYPDRVRALALLEPALLHLTPEGQQLDQDLADLVTSAAERGIDRLGETFLRAINGDAAWEQYPEEEKRLYADLGAGLVADFRGGNPEIDQATLATIDKPALLVKATESPEPLQQVADVVAAAMPNARIVRVGGDHEIYRAHPVVLDFIREVLANKKSRVA